MGGDSESLEGIGVAWGGEVLRGIGRGLLIQLRGMEEGGYW